MRPSGRIPQPSGQGRVSGQGKVPSGLGKVPRKSRFPKVGEEFDGYNVRQLLGQGNMGRIYRARDRMGRNVALKIILKEVASEEGLARFEREGQAMAAIPRHKHVVSVHSSGTYHGMPYLVLDFVAGETLEDVLRRGPLAVEQAALVTEKLARALDHVHQSGVLHRDLKPANILIRSEDGEPVLTDFGLAGLRGANRLTQTGDVLGTPLYMAPEQVMGLHKQVDGRADVWALGVLLYEMAVGTVPFPGRTMVEVSQAITNTDPVPLSKACPAADTSLAGIVGRALTKDMEFRTPSPGAVASSLRAWRRSLKHSDEAPPPPLPSGPNPIIIAAGVLGLVLLLTIIIAFATADGDEPDEGSEAATVGEQEKPATPEGDPAEAGLKQALKALAGNEPQQALTALESVDFQGRGDLVSSLRAARVQSLRIGLDKTRLKDLAALRTALQLVELLNGLLPRRPGESDLADAVLSLVLELEGKTTAVFEKQNLELLETLGQSGLRPTRRVGLSFLDALLKLNLSKGIGGSRLGPERNKLYYRALLALARMEVPLLQTHVSQLQGRIKRRGRRDSIESYVRMSWRIARAYGGDSRHDRVRQSRVTSVQELNDFLLLKRSEADQLGARNRARAILLVERRRGGDEGYNEARLLEARRLDPHDPMGLGLLAAYHLYKAKVLLSEGKHSDRVKDRLEDACQHADDSLTLFEEQKLGESVSAVREIQGSLIEVAIRCHAARGRKIDPARLRDLIALVRENDHELRGRMARAREDGQATNALLREKIAKERARD